MVFVVPLYCKQCRKSQRLKSLQNKRRSMKTFPICLLSSTDTKVSILVLSNGHGEDKVSASVTRRVIELLRDFPVRASVSVLPLVGNGSAYLSITQDASLAGPVKEFPSGGFINRRPQVFLKDIREGLLSLTYSQFQTISKWSSSCVGRKLIMAVGDVWPLFLAAQAKTPFIFIGTAKSEYYVRDERGPLRRRFEP